MTPDSRELQRRLGHEFQQLDLLEQALTHRSAGGHNNERLEFLGDSILGFVVAEALYHDLPQASEGDLSRMRASLVKRETLASLARDLSLGDYLRLGSGELKSGGFRRDSTLADALEALFGAIFLDAGYPASRACILRLLQRRLEDLPAAASLKDPKTLLQEFLQSRSLSLPEYHVVDSQGKDHNRTFTVECRTRNGELTTRASGRSRRRAEQSAAEAMLQSLGAVRSENS